MANKTILIKSDYASGDLIGPFRPATSSDTITDGFGNVLNTVFLTISSSYSLTTTDYGVFVTASATPIIITLPSASNNSNRVYEIIRTDTNGTQVTLSSSGGSISGNSTVGLISYASVSAVSNGSNWYIF